MIQGKRAKALAVITAFGLVAAACGSSSKSASTTAAPATTKKATATTAAAGADTTAAAATTAAGYPATTAGAYAGKAVKLGVAFDTGGRGDGTFNDSAARGADKAKAELGATIDELEATKSEDRGPNLATLTKNGDNPIIAVGFLFETDLKTIAAANPNTTYGIVDDVIDAPNIRSLVFAAEQGSFLVGAAAALKSKDHHIGFIGGQEIDLIKTFEAGYIAGAKAVDPTIKIESKYLGAAGDNAAWSSPDKAKEIADGWFKAGADIVYTAAGGSGAGTIAAAVQDNAWAIGVDSDQWALAKPDEQKHILTSMIKRVDTAVYLTAKAVGTGDTKGGIFTFDLSNDGVGYATSGGFLDDVKTKLEALKADIISGKIKVPTKM
jgi:basic membrane protein A